MTSRLFLCLSAITAALAGCVPMPEPVSPRPEGAIPIDIIGVQSDLSAQFPQAKAFGALAPSGEGVIFALDGTATFVNPAFGTRIESTISGFDGNTICVAEAGNWTGICMSLFETQSGGYFCEGTFGDGGALSYPCTLNPVIETDASVSTLTIEAISTVAVGSDT